MRWNRRRALTRAPMNGGRKVLNPDREFFKHHGFCIRRGVFAAESLKDMALEFVSGLRGQRLFSSAGIIGKLVTSGTLLEIANEFAPDEVRPTRVILFDKSPERNWSVGWHQDRTIAVAKRSAVDGYSVWSKKGGEWHVEPPFQVIEQTITLRLSVDPTTEHNGALEVIPGSHLEGRLNNEQTKSLAHKNEPDVIETGEGDVVILSSAVIHRSRPSKANSRRRVLQIDYSWAKLPPPLEWAFQ